MKRLLAFVIVVALLGSCAKNGEYENYHPNGKVSDWILYENDHIIHSISYDTSGNFSSEMKFVDEFPYFQKSYIDGILTFFHESTQDSDHLVKREAYFNRNGQKEGTWIWLCNDKYQLSQKFGANAIGYNLMYKDIQDVEGEYDMGGWDSAEADLDSNEIEACKVEDVFEDILKEQAGLMLKKMVL